MLGWLTTCCGVAVVVEVVDGEGEIGAGTLDVVVVALAGGGVVVVVVGGLAVVVVVAAFEVVVVRLRDAPSSWLRHRAHAGHRERGPAGHDRDRCEDRPLCISESGDH